MDAVDWPTLKMGVFAVTGLGVLPARLIFHGITMCRVRTNDRTENWMTSNDMAEASWNRSIPTISPTRAVRTMTKRSS